MKRTKKDKLRQLLVKISPEEKSGAMIASLKDDLKEIGDSVLSKQEYTDKIMTLRAEIQSLFSEIKGRLDSIPKVEELKSEYLSELSKLEARVMSIANSNINDLKSTKNSISSLQDSLDALRLDYLSHKGGGSMPRKISINGTTIATRYADINYISSWTAVNNDSAKRTDITASGSAGTPATGPVLDAGTNNTDFATAKALADSHLNAISLMLGGNSNWTLTRSDTSLNVIDLGQSNQSNFLTAFTMNSLTNVTTSVTFTGSGLTTASASSLTTIGQNLNVGNCTALTSLNLSSLATTQTGLSISGNPVLPSVSLNALTGYGINQGGGNGTLTVDSNALLSSFSATSLVNGGGDFIITNNPALTSISLPLFANPGTAGFICNISTNAILATLSLPSLISDGAAIVQVNGNVSLTTLTIGTGLLSVNIDFSGNALDQTSVDTILANVDGAGQLTGNLNLSGGTNTAPTGGALNANVVSLQGKGWTVTNN